MVGVRVVTAAFYSMQDTRTPVKSAVLALVCNVLLSLALMGPLGHCGLALANAAASAVNFSLLFWFLRRKLGRIQTRVILRSFLKTAAASLVMAAFAAAALRGGMWLEGGRAAVKSAALGATMAVSLALYLIICRLLRSAELAWLLEFFRSGPATIPTEEGGKGSTFQRD
jgi:putative peptidoglycan lipid II flippase